MATLHLNPIIDGCERHVKEWFLDSDGVTLVGALDGSSDNVKLTVQGSSLSYSIDGRCDITKEIIYFANSQLTDHVVRGFLPDAYNRVFLPEESVTFSYSATAKESQFDRQLNYIWMTCPAPKALSFCNKWSRDSGNWWGLMIPDPLPLYEVVGDFRQGAFQLAFTHFDGTCYEGRYPRATFHFGLDDENGILDPYVDYYRQNGYLDEQKKSWDWWSKPLFCTWGQQEYMENSFGFDDNPLTASALTQWTDKLALSTGSREFNIIIDALWFDHFGDYHAHWGRFGGNAGLRQWIDRMKELGHRVILWYTPLWVTTESRIVAENPHYLVRDLSGEPAKVTNTEIFDHLYLLDCSRADVQAHMKETIRRMLSSDADCLNADGFKIDMNYYGPVAGKHQIHSKEWGIGELLWYNLVKFIHAESIRHKEDAFLTLSGAEPYLQKVAPVQRLNDLFPVHQESPAMWYKRAELVKRMLPGVLIDVDGWPNSRIRAAEYSIVSAAFGIPVTYHVDGFDTKEKLGESDYNRLRAIWNAYRHAPIRSDMEITIDSQHQRYFRTYTSGPLSGFYSALSLHGRVLAAYREDSAIIAAISDMAIEIPLPPRIQLEGIYKGVEKDLLAIPFQYNEEDHTVIFKVEDCSKGLMGYTISYKLQ